jgi:hypothetical protein
MDGDLNLEYRQTRYIVESPGYTLLPGRGTSRRTEGGRRNHYAGARQGGCEIWKRAKYRSPALPDSPAGGLRAPHGTPLQAVPSFLVALHRFLVAFDGSSCGGGTPSVNAPGAPESRSELPT